MDYQVENGNEEDEHVNQVIYIGVKEIPSHFGIGKNWKITSIDPLKGILYIV
jgi:hypothetical protein